VQAASTASRSDAEKFLKQLEATKRELSTIKATRRKREQDLRAHVSTMRAERAAEVQMLAGKLEESISAYNRSAGEAERMLAAKESLLRKYKTEAQSMASKLQAAEVPHESINMPEVLFFANACRHMLRCKSRPIRGSGTRIARAEQCLSKHVVCTRLKVAVSTLTGDCMMQGNVVVKEQEVASMKTQIAATHLDNETLREELNYALAAADEGCMAAERAHAASTEVRSLAELLCSCCMLLFSP
jgi:hypothetical protein